MRLTNLWQTFKRRFLRTPAPRALIAIYLSVRWGARVSLQADIQYPLRLRLRPGAVLDRCKIVCSGNIILGDKVYIHDGVILDALGGSISIGAHTIVNPYCVLYGAGGLEIGSEVGIAAHTVMIPANHGTSDLDTPMMRQPIKHVGIKIADNVWIASHCVILDGVIIESGAVVAAGAIVNRAVAENTIVAGVPAKPLRVRGT